MNHIAKVTQSHERQNVLPADIAEAFLTVSPTQMRRALVEILAGEVEGFHVLPEHIQECALLAFKADRPWELIPPRQVPKKWRIPYAPRCDTREL